LLNERCALVKNADEGKVAGFFGSMFRLERSLVQAIIMNMTAVKEYMIFFMVI
jgi:hypothetical protein